MDSRHKFSAKIICLTGQEDAAQQCASAFGSEADVYRLEKDANGKLLLFAAGASDGTQLEHPLTGPTVLALYDDAIEGPEDEVISIWQESGLPVPGKVKVEIGETDFAGVSQSLLSIQSNLVTEAMRRNSSLLTQIAALRRRCEDLNTQVDGLRHTMAVSNSSSHRLLHEAERWGDDLVLAAGQRVTQRLPVVILPSLIGAISANIRVRGSGQIKARLTSVEDDAVQEDASYDFTRGEHVLFMPFRSEINPNTRLLDITFENTGPAQIEIQSGLQESPEETAWIDGEPPEDNSVRSLRLGIWSHGPEREDRSFRTTPMRRQVASWDIWRNGATRLTPGFEERNWLSKQGKDGLLLHPLPDAVAVGNCPVKRKKESFNGMQLEVSLPSQAYSIVRLRLIFSNVVPNFETSEQAAEFAFAETADGDIARSAWVQVVPGSSRPVSLICEQAMSECNLIIAATTDGHPIDHAHLVVSNLQMIIEDDSV